MQNHGTVYVAMPSLHLGEPLKTAEEFSAILKKCRFEDEDILIYPADAVLGDIGSLQYNQDLQDARNKAESLLSLAMPCNGGLSIFPHLEEGEWLGYRNGMLVSENPIQEVMGMPAIILTYGEKGDEQSIEVFFNQEPDYLCKKGHLLSRLGSLCIVVCNDSGESSGKGSYSGQVFSNLPSVSWGTRRIHSFIIAEHQSEEFSPTYFPYTDFEREETPSVLPFIPNGGAYENIILKDVEDAFSILSNALARRLERIGSDKVVIGLSGGLDSTLALLVAIEAFKNAQLSNGLGNEDLKDHIFLYSLPCFGTSKTTLGNINLLSEASGIPVKEISIKESVLQHFKDIGHDPSITNSAFENAQARERTQVLMDLANDIGGLMVGTGDMSELALGWTTFGGDHLSMYDTNAGVPKTMVRYLCLGYAKLHPEFEKAVQSIIGTPVSPELLPTDKEGSIAQKTEEALGPYEVMDYFLYGFLSSAPIRMIYEKACKTFANQYDSEQLKRWFSLFIRRFVNQSFKRNCLCDGPVLLPFFLGGSGYRFPGDMDPSYLLRVVEAL